VRGAIAAGHPLTAEAGARILAEGGNAVDACVAAAFVSWVAESPLTGPGAGGFMLVHRARDRSDRVLDFFVAVPGAGLPPGERAEMLAVDVAFSADATQAFRIGAAACGVPGTVAGLGEAHRMYGSLPWPELAVPAIELARKGVELTPAQDFLHAVLDTPLRLSAEGRRIYGEERRLVAGDRLVIADLAGTLELLAEAGPVELYRGELARRLSDAVCADGGLITLDDLSAYRVIRRTPVRVAFRGYEFVSNPPPSAGGVLIGFALRVLHGLGRMPPAGSADAIERLAEVMREATRARGGAFASDLHRGGLATRLLGEERVEEARRAVRARVREPAREGSASPSTTHISVVDGSGNAASLSASTGVGSGLIVPGTGIHVNNMLGEEDLTPLHGAARPGRRLTSMMSPSLVLRDGRPRLVVGSAGSVRLRAAILQIVTNVLEHRMAVMDAIEAPRVHLEGDVLHLEGGVPEPVAESLSARGYDVARWPERNLYFGGASAVALGGDDELAAAGDPRRGGASLVVP
jgi:gamma-glutamyltranspeptidase/glutathione hydrolase